MNAVVRSQWRMLLWLRCCEAAVNGDGIRWQITFYSLSILARVQGIVLYFSSVYASAIEIHRRQHHHQHHNVHVITVDKRNQEKQES